MIILYKCKVFIFVEYVITIELLTMSLQTFVSTHGFQGVHLVSNVPTAADKPTANKRRNSSYLFLQISATRDKLCVSCSELNNEVEPKLPPIYTGFGTPQSYIAQGRTFQRSLLTMPYNGTKRISNSKTKQIQEDMEEVRISYTRQ